MLTRGPVCVPVFRQGDPGSSWYAVLAGQVEFRYEGPGIRDPEVSKKIGQPAAQSRAPGCLPSSSQALSRDRLQWQRCAHASLCAAILRRQAFVLEGKIALFHLQKYKIVFDFLSFVYVVSNS